VIRRLFILLAILGSVARAQEFDHEFDRMCVFDFLYSQATVGPDFSLKISFHEAPVAGSRISLMKDERAVATAKTDSHGIARFTAIPAGKYYANSPDGLLFPSGSLEIEVKAENAAGKKAEKFELDWPNHSIAVRYLRGRFDVAEEAGGPQIPLRNALVELRDVRTARLIEYVQTDANGDYEFATNDPGIYALRLTLPKKKEAGSESRDLAVEIDPAAVEGSIPELEAVQSDCDGRELLQRSDTGEGWVEQ
jgi:hypothetical protein